MSESFSTQPIASAPAAYLYNEYSDDEDLQAFFAAANTFAVQYLAWFTGTPLSVYTNTNISGLLLDWTATNIYGVSRPILTTSSTTTSGPLGTNVLGTHPLGIYNVVSSGTATPVTDDIYKRTLTWILYRGDGLQFSMPWLLRRVERLLGGVNGTDAPVDQATRPTITVSGRAFTITVPTANAASVTFQQLMAQGFLPTPLPYTFSVTVA